MHILGRRRRRSAVGEGLLAAAVPLSAVVLVSTAATPAQANVALSRVSTDPYTNGSSQLWQAVAQGTEHGAGSGV